MLYKLKPKHRTTAVNLTLNFFVLKKRGKKNKKEENEMTTNDCRALRGSLASLLAEGYRAKRVLDAVRAAAVSGTREARQSLGRKERSGLRPNGSGVNVSAVFHGIAFNPMLLGEANSFCF